MATSSTSSEPTARGRIMMWLAGLATGAAWLGGDEHARLAAAMLAAPLIVDFVVRQRHLHHTGITVRPRRTTAGATYRETLTIEHRGRRPLRRCQLHEPRTMRGARPVLLPTLSPFAPTMVQLLQRSLIRSHVLERVFVLESRSPLGIFQTRSVVTVTTDMVTEPARIALHGAVLSSFDDSDQAQAQRSTQRGPEFHALREHQPDEDARGVHALRSAALGTLVRRVTSGSQPRSVGVVLDMRRPPGQPAGRGMRRLEWSLGACATLVEQLRHRGANVHVLVFDTEPEEFEVQSPSQTNHLLTMLAEAGMSEHHELATEQHEALRQLQHCYWIAAGGHFSRKDVASVPGRVTVVQEEQA